MIHGLNIRQSFTLIALLAAGGSTDTVAHASAVDCAIDCKNLKSRNALPLEYDLCGATDEFLATPKEQVVDREPTDVLSGGTKCLIEKLSGSGISVGKLVVPKSSPRKNYGSEAMSLDLGLARACLGPVGLGDAVPPAHRDLTQRALQNSKNEYGFSFGAKKPSKLIELASEQADNYEWNNPAAHAQTPNGDDQNQDDAVKVFKKHLQQVTTKVQKACCAHNYQHAAYQLGYLFHAIQDLSTHTGMTNDEHAYWLKKKNPDLETDRLKRAQEWSMDLLQAYGESDTYGACVKEASKLEASGSNWDALSLAGGYGAKDATKTALAKFVMGALQLSLPKQQSWFTPAAAKGWFDGNVLPIVRESLNKTCK